MTHNRIKELESKLKAMEDENKRFKFNNTGLMESCEKHMNKIKALEEENKRLKKLEMGDDHLRLLMYRETHLKSKELVDILIQYVGETGKSEDAIEVFKRKMEELSSLKSLCEKMAEALNHYSSFCEESGWKQANGKLAKETLSLWERFKDGQSEQKRRNNENT